MRRRSDPAVRARVEQLLAVGLAAWCPIVRLELWAGVSTEQERAALREYEQRIPELAINDEIWQSACDLADRCRKAGKRAPASDLLIAACARYHGVELESADAHFDLLKTL
jgi:predicted nucleic acid-binding protein